MTRDAASPTPHSKDPLYSSFRVARSQESASPCHKEGVVHTQAKNAARPSALGRRNAPRVTPRPAASPCEQPECRRRCCPMTPWCEVSPPWSELLSPGPTQHGTSQINMCRLRGGISPVRVADPLRDGRGEPLPDRRRDAVRPLEKDSPLIADLPPLPACDELFVFQPQSRDRHPLDGLDTTDGRKHFPEPVHGCRDRVDESMPEPDDQVLSPAVGILRPTALPFPRACASRAGVNGGVRDRPHVPRFRHRRADESPGQSHPPPPVFVRNRGPSTSGLFSRISSAHSASPFSSSQSAKTNRGRSSAGFARISASKESRSLMGRSPGAIGYLKADVVLGHDTESPSIKMIHNATSMPAVGATQ